MFFLGSAARILGFIGGGAGASAFGKYSTHAWFVVAVAGLVWLVMRLRTWPWPSVFILDPVTREYDWTYGVGPWKRRRRGSLDEIDSLQIRGVQSGVDAQRHIRSWEICLIGNFPRPPILGTYRTEEAADRTAASVREILGLEPDRSAEEITTAAAAEVAPPPVYRGLESDLANGHDRPGAGLSPFQRGGVGRLVFRFRNVERQHSAIVGLLLVAGLFGGAAVSGWYAYALWGETRLVGSVGLGFIGVLVGIMVALFAGGLRCGYICASELSRFSKLVIDTKGGAYRWTYRRRLKRYEHTGELTDLGRLAVREVEVADEDNWKRWQVRVLWRIAGRPPVTLVNCATPAEATALLNELSQLLNLRVLDLTADEPVEYEPGRVGVEGRLVAPPPPEPEPVEPSPNEGSGRLLPGIAGPAQPLVTTLPPVPANCRIEMTRRPEGVVFFLPGFTVGGFLKMVAWSLILPAIAWVIITVRTGEPNTLLVWQNGSWLTRAMLIGTAFVSSGIWQLDLWFGREEVEVTRDYFQLAIRRFGRRRVRAEAPLDAVRFIVVKGGRIVFNARHGGLIRHLFGGTLTFGERTWLAEALRTIIDDPETLGSAGD